MHVPPEAENAVEGAAGMHAVQTLTDGGNGSAQIGVGAESESCGECEAGLSSTGQTAESRGVPLFKPSLTAGLLWKPG